MNNFDDDSAVYLFSSEEKVQRIKALKPYIIFKKDTSFHIEELPIVVKESLKERYGEYYEIFYDAYKVSEYTLTSKKIDYVKTTIGEIKSEIDREIKEDIKYLRKDR